MFGYYVSIYRKTAQREDFHLRETSQHYGFEDVTFLRYSGKFRAYACYWCDKMSGNKVIIQHDDCSNDGSATNSWIQFQHQYGISYII